MFLALAIGIPVFLLFGGAMLAFAFNEPARDEDYAEAILGEPVSVVQPAEQVCFLGPVGWMAGSEKLSVEDLVACVEGHLRDEAEATKAFAEKPSARTLWSDRLPRA
jgi:hypothetical protein